MNDEKFKITEDRLLEVAERYGLTARKVGSSEDAGFKVGGKKTEADELFELLFQREGEDGK